MLIVAAFVFFTAFRGFGLSGFPPSRSNPNWA